MVDDNNQSESRRRVYGRRIDNDGINKAATKMKMATTMMNSSSSMSGGGGGIMSYLIFGVERVG